MEVKTLKRYQHRTIQWLLKKAEEHFNHYIRLRDSEDGWGVCISSGRPIRVPDKNSHAGHFYPSGNYPRLRFHEDNVNLQSLEQNYFKSGNVHEYRKNLIAKIGIERVEALDLIAANKSVHKWDRFFLIEVIETYKQKVKELKKPSIVKQVKK